MRVAPTFLALLLWAAAVAPAACAGSAPVRTRPKVSIAGGFFLELLIRGADNYAVIYRVNGDRKLGFGGGADAVNRRLRNLLDRHGWFDGAIEETGEPPQRRTRIHLRGPDGSRRHRIRGRNPGVDAVADLLDHASRRRLEREIRDSSLFPPRK